MNMTNSCASTFWFGVDPRVELLSIIFRLIGNHEYNQLCRTGYPGGIKLPLAYAKEVDQHFKLFQEHPFIQLAPASRQMEPSANCEGENQAHQLRHGTA